MQFETVQLETARLIALHSFYAETLELPVSDGDEGTISIEMGATTLVFRETDDETDREPFYHFAVSVPEHRFDDARAWLADRMDLIADDGDTEFFFEFMNAHAIYFTDPAGNIGELIARHDHPTAADGAFDSGSFLEVSEVGLPVHNVPTMLDEFDSELSLSKWNDSDETTFNCVGDTRVMFIVVPAGRGWFPTGDPAEVHPITVTVTTTSELDVQYQLSELPYQITNHDKSSV
jgi:catechol-2,3-dioxygenase